MSGRTPPPDPARTSWLGRASVPEQLPPPTDPYWPPLEPDGYAPPPGYILVPDAPPRRRTGLGLFSAVVAVFALCCAGGATLAYIIHSGASTPVAAHTGSPAKTSGKPATNPTSAAPARTPARPGTHAPVQDGKFEFVVGSLSCGHPTVNQSVISKSAQGQFCLLDLTVRNIGTTSWTFADSFQKALGSNGTVYGPDTAAGAIANGSGENVWSLIGPGDQVSGIIVFDIPRSAAIATVELHDSPLSHGVTIAVG